MSVFRRMFSSAYRSARRAEAAGEYRKAAELYVEAEDPEAAANALLFHAARTSSLEERVAAYHDALRWLPPEHPRREQVEARLGLAVLEDARPRGVQTAEDRRRLTDAAERLERAGRPAEAATAWELLGRLDDVARCLQKAGEVERLEALLDRTGQEEDRDRRLRRLISDYEMAMKVGQRLDARRALREAAELAPDDASVADLLRRLEARLPVHGRVELDVAGRRILFVGKLPAVIGRTGADVPLRGSSISRVHAEVALKGGRVVVKDLGSRNGTLVRGVAIGGEMELGGPTEIGLGDDVPVSVEPGDGQLSLTVLGGLDRALRVVLGDGLLVIPELAARISFPGGAATLSPGPACDLRLGGNPCSTAVVLLVEDEITVDGTPIEVRG